MDKMPLLRNPFAKMVTILTYYIQTDIYSSATWMIGMVIGSFIIVLSGVDETVFYYISWMSLLILVSILPVIIMGRKHLYRLSIDWLQSEMDIYNKLDCIFPVAFLRHINTPRSRELLSGPCMELVRYLETSYIGPNDPILAKAVQYIRCESKNIIDEDKVETEQKFGHYFDVLNKK